jgi:hypothetical protein
MTDLTKDRDRALTTADLAGAGSAPEFKVPEFPGPPLRREYVEEPRVKAPSGGPAVEATPLFAADETEHLRSDWSEIQTAFVDEPRKCVEKADQLVARVVQRLAESFSQERSRLEGQWSKGEDVSTEDLRIALQRYRSFFDRLLSV